MRFKTFRERFQIRFEPQPLEPADMLQKSRVRESRVSLAARSEHHDLLELKARRFGQPENAQVFELLAQQPGGRGRGITKSRTPPGLSQRYVWSRKTASSLWLFVEPASQS
jgi:hypothetical protein